MEKVFVVKETFKVLGCPSGDFTYITAVYRDRNEGIRGIEALARRSKNFTLQRLSENEWVQFLSDDEVGAVTEILLDEVNIY